MLAALRLHPSLHLFRCHFLLERRNGPHVPERIRDPPLPWTKEHIGHWHDLLHACVNRTLKQLVRIFNVDLRDQPVRSQPSIDSPRFRTESPSLSSQWAIFPFDIVKR
jgi:hypothetical protein